MPTAVPDRDDRLDRLYALLPAVHRRRDAENGDPLRALLEVIAEQAAVIEDDIGQRYDDWFIETCADWVVPYIGELVGVSLPAASATPSRGTVANAVRERRRKGGVSVLADLAWDIGEWPARVVEFGRLLGQTQSLRLAQPTRGLGADVRRAVVAPLGPESAFDTRAHTIDVRRTTERDGGRFLPADVGVFVWRLKSYRVTRAPAACLEDIGPHLYSFSVLRNDAPLFNSPRDANGARGRVNGPLDAPVPLDPTLFAAPRKPGERFHKASPDVYGLETIDGKAVARSTAIWVKGWPNAKSDGAQPVPADRIIVADLDDWTYLPPRDHIAVDPVRGRIAFPPRQFPRRRGVSVSYSYGFSADIGGGEYERPLSQHADAQPFAVQGVTALRDRLRDWEPVLDDEGLQSAPSTQPEHAVIEITDSGVYELQIAIMLAPGHSLQIRAAQGARPVILLQDLHNDAPDSMSIAGGEGARFILDGIMVAGRGVLIEGALASVTLRHATLVPGWSLDPDCDPKRPSEPSIELVDSGACLVIQHSIVGSIQVNNDEVATEPTRLVVEDSILDATGADCDSPQCEALGAAGSRLAFTNARFARSTVIGRVMTHAIESADNSIFLGRVTVARRQSGYMRFCHVAPLSRTPRRFRCQPDYAQTQGRDAATAAGLGWTADDDAMAQAAARPRFDSLRYGQPAYGRLSADCPPEIARGADDGGEMGVFHHLQSTRRLDSLAAALDDHAPVGVAAGVILAD